MLGKRSNPAEEVAIVLAEITAALVVGGGGVGADVEVRRLPRLPLLGLVDLQQRLGGGVHKDHE